MPFNNENSFLIKLQLALGFWETAEIHAGEIIIVKCAMKSDSFYKWRVS